MALVDDNAKANSLKNDYGSGHGSASPSTFYLAIFADSAFATELTGTGGIPRVPISNVDAQLLVTGTTLANVNTLTSSASTGAWASSGNYGALMSAASGGDKWDGGALSSAVTVAAAGTAFVVNAGALQIGQP